MYYEIDAIDFQTGQIVYSNIISEDQLLQGVKDAIYDGYYAVVYNPRREKNGGTKTDKEQQKEQ